MHTLLLQIQHFFADSGLELAIGLVVDLLPLLVQQLGIAAYVLQSFKVAVHEALDEHEFVVLVHRCQAVHADALLVLEAEEVEMLAVQAAVDGWLDIAWVVHAVERAEEAHVRFDCLVVDLGCGWQPDTQIEVLDLIVDVHVLVVHVAALRHVHEVAVVAHSRREAGRDRLLLDLIKEVGSWDLRALPAKDP